MKMEEIWDIKMEEIWDIINEAAQSRDTINLEVALKELEGMALERGPESEISFAAGYAAYMLPTGHVMRKNSENWFLDTIISQPGHFEAVLYLAYISIDKGEWERALSLLFAISPETSSNDLDDIDVDSHLWLMDRLVEARVFALCQIEKWAPALEQLAWFNDRMTSDPDCGLILINFLKMLDHKPESDTIAVAVLKRIRWIVQADRDN